MNAKLTVGFLLFCYVQAEFSQKRKCNNEQFECYNGQCISKSSWCPTYDYYHDSDNCNDISNTFHCSQAPYNCTKNHIHCEDDGRCIPVKWICDQRSDCVDSSDEIGCLGRFRLNDIGAKNAVLLAKEWIIKERRINWGWGQNSARAIVALYLSGNIQLEHMNYIGQLMRKQLKIQLSESILRNGIHNLSAHKLAHYIHSLLAMCHDPKNVLGKNLVKELEELSKSSKSMNPFVTLALCNSNSALPSSSIKKLVEIMLKPSKPEIIDLQAYAAMTFNCLQRKNLTYLESVYQNFTKNQTLIEEYKNITSGKDLFVKLQKMDGSFGNTYITAVVIQALLSAGNYDSVNLDLYKAYKHILHKQKADGSFGNMMLTYLVLPLLHQKTLVDLGNINCSLEYSEIRYPTLKEELESKEIEKQKVEYLIWLGQNRDISFQILMTVPVNITFYQVMLLAAELDSKYSFQYASYQNGKFVYSIFNKLNDPEERKYWKLYRANGVQLDFAGEYPDKVIPKNGDKFIYWYKHHEVVYQ